MTPRKKVTDATKAKLPLPANHPQTRPKRKRPHATAPNPDVVPWTDPFTVDWVAARRAPSSAALHFYGSIAPTPVPVEPRAYPWPLRVANWLDAVPFRVRAFASRKLMRLAVRMAPRD